MSCNSYELKARYLIQTSIILGIALLILGALAASGHLSPKAMAATFMGIGMAAAVSVILSANFQQKARLSTFSQTTWQTYQESLRDNGEDSIETQAAKELYDTHLAFLQAQQPSSMTGTVLKILLAVALIGVIGNGVLRGHMSFKVPAGLAMAAGGLSALTLLCAVAGHIYLTTEPTNN